MTDFVPKSYRFRAIAAPRPSNGAVVMSQRGRRGDAVRAPLQGRGALTARRSRRRQRMKSQLSFVSD